MGKHAWTRGGAAAAVLLGLSNVLAACYSHDGSMKKINTEGLTRNVEQCNQGNGFGCKSVGDELLGMTARSRASDWQLGRDRGGAKRAYHLGCMNGYGTACAAIVEYRLFDSEEEKQRYELRAKYYSGRVRDAQEIAADEAKIRAETRERNKEVAAIRRAEEADSQRSWSEFGKAVQQMQPQIEATVNRAAGGRAGGAGGAGGAPGVEGGAGAGGASACAKCNTMSRAACDKEAVSAGCYNAMAAINECLASTPGCASDPNAARAEAARLRKAAAEIKR